MQTILQNAYIKLNAALMKSGWLGAAIGFQHRHFPLPARVFGMLFATHSLARLFAFYGHHAFHADYAPRISNADYWMSDRSVYWHLYRRHDTDTALIADTAVWPGAMIQMCAARHICEPGFGIGKTTRALFAAGIIAPDSVIAFEPVATVRRAARRACAGLPVDVRGGGLDDIHGVHFDTLLLTGGVLMFYSPTELARIFGELPKSCERVIVLQEGAPREIARPDGTWMHGLPALMSASGFGDGFSAVGENGQYRLFIAARHHELPRSI